MIKCNCGSWWIWSNIKSGQMQHTFSRRHFANQSIPQSRTFKGSVSQKQMNFEKLLQLTLSSSAKGRRQVAVKKLPVKKLYDIWSFESSVCAGTCFSLLSLIQHSMCLPPRFWQNKEIGPKYQAWGPETHRTDKNTCGIIHMAKMYLEVSHDLRACFPLYIYIF